MDTDTVTPKKEGWAVVIKLLDPTGKPVEGETVKLISPTIAMVQYTETLAAANNRNLLVFHLDDVKKQLTDVMENVYGVEVKITDDMLRAIWYEVTTDSVCSNINDLIYDACIDYARENLLK